MYILYNSSLRKYAVKCIHQKTFIPIMFALLFLAIIQFMLVISSIKNKQCSIQVQ
jgi:hypothetical protein